MNRPRPHDLYAERALLGAMTLGPQVVENVCRRLGPNDFYDETHARVFHAIRDRVLEVGANVSATELAELIEDVPAVLGFLEAVTSTDEYHVDFYCKRICEAAQRRRFIAKAEAVCEAARDPHREIGEVTQLAGWHFAGERFADAIRVGRLVENHPTLHEPIVDGLIRRGEVANVIADPKRGKSWLGYGLAVSLATGSTWLDFATVRTPVLVIDNELHAATLANRFTRVAEAMGFARDCPFDLADLDIDVWPVRGRSVDLNEIAVALATVERGRYGLVIVDALYRALPAGTNENDNAAVAQVYNVLNTIAAKLDAAIVCIHHATKGNQAGKTVTDMGSGAGSQSRAADVHVAIRPHEDDGILVLDAAVRSFAPVVPRCLRFDFPLWAVADGPDPAKLAGRRKSPSDRGDDDRNRRLRDDICKVVEACRQSPEGETKNVIRDRTNLPHARFKAAHQRMVDNGTLIETTIVKSCRTSPYPAWMLNEGTDRGAG